jgi:hypothetical protein
MDTENKVSKQEIAERKKEDEKVTKFNDETYKDRNIKDVKTEREKFKDAKGHVKEKVIEHVTYRNGVVKSRLTSVYKDGRVIYNVASKTKKRKSA